MGAEMWRRARSAQTAPAPSGRRPRLALPTRMLVRAGGGSFLPERRLAAPGAGDLLVEGVGVVEAAVEHDLRDAVAVADILGRIGVEDDEVGKLARLEAADVEEAVHPRRIDRAVAQRLDRGGAAADERPELPVGAEALLLA